MLATLALTAAALSGPVAEDCTFNGIPLHGRVEIVESFPDMRVQLVTSFPDIKIEYVTSFPGMP